MTSSNRARWLAETGWLAEHLNDPAVRIVDMRGYVRTSLVEPGVQQAAYSGARDEYLAGHIPGAIYLDWTRDIIDPEDPVPTQVADPTRIAATLSAAGITDETTVVAYDNHPTSQFATRLWWVLRYYGHDAVMVLNGGLARWQREGRPLSTALPNYPAAVFTPRPRPELRARAEDVLGLLGKPGVTLIDARDSNQYNSEVRRGPRGGHIPGAVHLSREEFLNEEGLFRSDEELRTAADAIGVTPEQRVVAYCNGGVAATVVLFGLGLAGYEQAANYDGSWNEWGTRPELPIEG